MVSSAPGKAGLVFAFISLGLIIASIVVVDWVYAVQGTLTRRYGIWQLYDISSNTYYTLSPGTVSVRIEAGRGCMVAAGALALFGVITGIAYLIMKDPWAPAKRYVLIMYCLGGAFAGVLCAVGPALIYDSSNYPSASYSSWSISTAGIIAFVSIAIEAVTTLLVALEWRWFDRTFGYNLQNTDPELLQDLRDYWQSRGRWEERQVIDEDWAIYRYLQQRRREQNLRLKRHIKQERRRMRDRESRNTINPQQQRRFETPVQADDPFNNDVITPPGFYPSASRNNGVYPG